ncbi:GNAT family N-acetyltransferase [Naumannella huperziae]
MTHQWQGQHPLIVRPAREGDRVPLERLWLIFRHEMSRWTGALPDPDGSYRSERLLLSLSSPSWAAWLLTAGDHPIGFCLTRAMDTPVRIVTSFFVVVPARRAGAGTALLRGVVTADPGTWSVAYQDANAAAARFWTKVASAYDPHHSLERRRVPGKPDLPPDCWVTFRVPRGADQ